MTKDVLITISGLQIADDTSAQPVEVITSGEYYCRNGNTTFCMMKSWRDSRE